MCNTDKQDNAIKALFHAYDIRGTAGEKLDCEQAMVIESHSQGFQPRPEKMP